MNKNLLIVMFLTALFIFPSITYSARGRWEQSTKISGFYTFAESPWVHSQNWHAKIIANFIRHSPFSTLSILPKIEYGETQDTQTGERNPTDLNTVMLTMDYTYNLTAYTYWRVLNFVPYGPVMVKKAATGELEIATVNDISIVATSAYGKSFSRYLNAEIGLQVIGGLTNFYASSNYNKPLGYRTKFSSSLGARTLTSGKNVVITGSLGLSYKFGRRISLDMSIYGGYSVDESDIIDEKRIIELTYELFY